MDGTDGGDEMAVSPRVIVRVVVPSVAVTVHVHREVPLDRVRHQLDDSFRSSVASLLGAFASGLTLKFDPCF